MAEVNDDAELIKLKGNPIAQQTIEKIWEEVRLKLGGHYAVEGIEMPKIRGLILAKVRFKRILAQLLASPHIYSTEEEEWGPRQQHTLPSAINFRAEDTWVIVKNGAGRCTVEEDLRHELLHIWESILGLSWGTLTQARH